MCSSHEPASADAGSACYYYQPYKKKHLSYTHSNVAKNHRRNPDRRIEFSDLVGRTHKCVFRLMFRMNNPCFNPVCSRIESNIGREKFKSEAYLSELEEAYTDNKKFNMFTANKKTTGGYLSGEIRVAIALRVLAGGSKFDIAAIFDIYISTVLTVYFGM